MALPSPFGPAAYVRGFAPNDYFARKLTTACLTPERAIDIAELERLVEERSDDRERLLFEVAAELYGREQGVSLSELLAKLDGEDLDRVLYAIAVLKRRQGASPRSPDDLWIRAAEPE